ncbi:MAG: hypothetical protein MJY58_06615 [Bacteroidaceae bacterium]|nr:hypothetical protein [Bacteroidaceae bacterium]
MSKIKQVLLLHAEGYSNRKIAAELQLNKGTVNEYMKFVKDHHLDISELTAKEDPELDRIFHAGSPAYTDKRMNDFLDELPMLRSELEDKHVTRYLLWQEYKGRHPDGYGKSQFFFHLKQNNLAERTATKAVLSETYVPGQKLFIDFAGDRLSYVDEDTGEMVPVEVFVASMPYSDYGYVLCIPSLDLKCLWHICHFQDTVCRPVQTARPACRSQFFLQFSVSCYMGFVGYGGKDKSTASILPNC